MEGRAVVLVRHRAKMRRVGGGSMETNRTEGGAGSRPSRGSSATPNPTVVKASWVECSDAVCRMRGGVPFALNVRRSQS